MSKPPVLPAQLPECLRGAALLDALEAYCEALALPEALPPPSADRRRPFLGVDPIHDRLCDQTQPRSAAPPEALLALLATSGDDCLSTAEQQLPQQQQLRRRRRQGGTTEPSSGGEGQAASDSTAAATQAAVGTGWGRWLRAAAELALCAWLLACSLAFALATVLVLPLPRQAASSGSSPPPGEDDREDDGCPSCWASAALDPAKVRQPSNPSLLTVRCLTTAA